MTLTPREQLLFAGSLHRKSKTSCWSKFKMRASNSSFPNLKQYERLEKQIYLTIIDDECGVNLHMSIIVVVLVTGSFLWSNVFRSLRRWLRPSFGLCSVQICSSLSKIASAITNCWNISAVWSASVPCVRRNFEALSTFCREILEKRTARYKVDVSKFVGGLFLAQRSAATCRGVEVVKNKVNFGFAIWRHLHSFISLSPFPLTCTALEGMSGETWAWCAHDTSTFWNRMSFLDNASNTRSDPQRF